MSAPNLTTVKIRGCWSLKRLPDVGNGSKLVECDCEKEWWDRLVWDNDSQAGRYKPIHSQYYKENKLRGSVLRIVRAYSGCGLELEQIGKTMNRTENMEEGMGVPTNLPCPTAHRHSQSINRSSSSSMAVFAHWRKLLQSLQVPPYPIKSISGCSPQSSSVGR
nr:unnamed protein product [Digitaria exilis]